LITGNIRGAEAGFISPERTMMKSLANDLLTVALGICKDIQVAYPAYGEVSRDIERLTRLLEHRGLGIFSLDLPNLDALLLQGLETGRLELVGPLSQRKSKRIAVPRFFSGLWLRVFNKNGLLKQEPDTNAILFLRQVFCLGKKASKMCTPQRVVNAIKEYVNVERHLNPPTLEWSADCIDPGNRGRNLHLREIGGGDLPLFPEGSAGRDSICQVLERCQQVADIVVGSFQPFSPVAYATGRAEAGQRPGFRHGPGAVADRRGALVNKYEFPRWSAKLESLFPYRDCGTVASDTETQPLNHEVPARLIAVAKTAKTPRLIAAEPTEHQWCQQLVLNYMVAEFKRLFNGTFIDLADQSKSGAMALAASKDGNLATVDLSSASDRLSCQVVERIFRSNQSLLHALHACRTRSLAIDIDGCEEEVILLRKYASQGTATTFPVQSLVFLCLALGCSIQGRVTWRKIRALRRKVRVFGDDIILPKHGYADLCSVLSHLGLKVNQEKSFSRGLFRESCGMDAYGGDDITPVKPQNLGSYGPESRMATVDASNNFFQKGFWHAAEAITRLLPSYVVQHLRVKRPGSEGFGLQSFSGEKTDHLKTRWNRDYHRTELKTWRVTSKSPKLQFGERFALLQYLTELPPQDQDWSNGITKRAQVRDRLGWEPAYF
jgi:hypothetical protein